MYRVYFAHCQKDYRTERAFAARCMIDNVFEAAAAVVDKGGLQVVDPSGDEIAKAFAAYKSEMEVSGRPYMGYFTQLVRGCDALVFMPVESGGIPAGVAQEILEARVHSIPVYEVKLGMVRADSLDTGRIWTIAKTREYVHGPEPEGATEEEEVFE